MTSSWTHAIAATALGLLVAAPLKAQPVAADCRVGAYRLEDGSVVDIGRASDAPLRWRKRDGTVGTLKPGGAGKWTSTLGWTDRPDGVTVSFSACPAERITFRGMPGGRIDFDVSEATFQSEGTRLVGRLVLPKGSGAVPIVVLLHGSESDSAVDFNSLQRRLPAEGVGAFVFDKRGTGRSGGKYTQDFDLLARDAVAALGEARRLAGARAGRIGYQGPSQGGWIAPLAARRAPVDFVIVGFGLAVSVLEEDRSAIALNMRMKGYGDDVMAKAMKLADASGAVAARGSEQDYEDFDRLRDAYRREPWFAHVRGDFTFSYLNLPTKQIRANRSFFEHGTPWHYDPLDTIASVAAPQLWILAQDDLEAPSEETASRLERLRKSGRPITTAIFPATAHGIYEYETKSDGTRVSVRQPDGYLAMMIDFARDGRLRGAYGSAALGLPPK